MYYCPYRNIYYEGTGELQYYSGRGMMRYTPKQIEYINTVENPHMSAVGIIRELEDDLKLNATMLAKQCDRSIELEAENADLKQKATYWEAKAGEYKALLENMERVG